jgi:predicted secreted hydrolase
LELGGVVAKDVRSDTGIDWIVPQIAKADHYIVFGLCHDDSQVAMSATALVGRDGHGIVI